MMSNTGRRAALAVATASLLAPRAGAQERCVDFAPLIESDIRTWNEPVEKTGLACE